MSTVISEVKKNKKIMADYMLHRFMEILRTSGGNLNPWRALQLTVKGTKCSGCGRLLMHMKTLLCNVESLNDYTPASAPNVAI